MKDFEAAIVQAGFDATDFAARQVLRLPGIKKVMPDIETVVVRRISTDEAITYSAGHLSTWVSEFEIDLNDGKFDHP